MALYRPFCKQHLFFDRILNRRGLRLPQVLPDARDREGEPGHCHQRHRIPGLQLRCPDVGPHRRPAPVRLSATPTSASRSTSTTRTAATVGRTSPTGPWSGSASITTIRPSRNGTSSTTSTASCTTPPTGRSSATTSSWELPRIPFMGEFRAISEAGRRLGELHVGYEEVEPWPLRWSTAEETPLSYRVEKMRLNKDQTTLVVNESLILADIPPEAFDYRLGNRPPWSGSSTSIRSRRTSGAASPPTRTGPTTPNTSSAWSNGWFGSAWRRSASSRGCRPTDPTRRRGRSAVRIGPAREAEVTPHPPALSCICRRTASTRNDGGWPEDRRFKSGSCACSTFAGGRRAPGRHPPLVSRWPASSTGRSTRAGFVQQFAGRELGQVLRDPDAAPVRWSNSTCSSDLSAKRIRPSGGSSFGRTSYFSSQRR